jgi:hypothetical protein
MVGVAHTRYNPRRRLGGRNSHPLDQSSQHESYIVESHVKSIMLFLRQKMEIARQEEKVLQLTRGAGGDMQKLTEFRSASTGTPLRDIRRDRESRSSHLVSNAIPLGFWKRSRGAIDAQNQRVALLPNLELFKVLHCTTLSKKLCVYLQLITKNCQPVEGLSW